MKVQTRGETFLDFELRVLCKHLSFPYGPHAGLEHLVQNISGNCRGVKVEILIRGATIN